MAKPPPPVDSPFWKFWEIVVRLNKHVYRLSGGKVGGRFGKAPILILHQRRAQERQVA